MKKYALIQFIIPLLIIINITFIAIAENDFKKNDDFFDYNKIDGYILYTPMHSIGRYPTNLINKDNEIINSWKSYGSPGLSVYLLPNGNILRTVRTLDSFGLGAGGRIQEFDWDGEIVWDYKYSNIFQYCLHHDIEPLPNGNVLMLGWEKKYSNEKFTAGRELEIFLDKIIPIYSTFIIEVKQTSLYTGEIVWEWHLWDHLIQEKFPDKDNYGVVKQHPELVDINYAKSNDMSRKEWIHANSIDYNPKTDQILITARNFNEIWIIDHNTTTQESKNHSGGKYGKGGDLLFRWGNSKAYNNGNVSDQQLFYPHDARWIEPGCIGEGNILIFNNGAKNRRYSTVDEIKIIFDDNKPIDAEIIWSYFNEEIPYRYNLCGAQRLSNNNTLICYSTGKPNIIEVNSKKEIVNSIHVKNFIFKVNFYDFDYLDQT